MQSVGVGFQQLDLRNATEHEYSCLSEFKNRMNCEYYPDDPAIPLEEKVAGWKAIPEFVEVETYVMWDSTSSTIISYGDIIIYHTGDNEHLADFMIEVLPEYRQKRLCRQTLALLLPFAQKHERTLLLTNTSDRIPESEILLERIGARKGLEMHTNQLKIAEFDKTLVDRWLENSECLHPEFETGFWDGSYPDTNISEVSALFEDVGKDAPRDNLEMEDLKYTPEILRQIEKSMFARGNQRWTMYLIDRSNGKMAGLTEMIWHPNRPAIVNQGFTGVYTAYRNKGLGHWLKAEMMKKVIDDHPEVEFIRTGNANSNAPMLKINIEMGFKPYTANTTWQMRTVQVEEYLSNRNT